jgi:hypothetical protein
VQPPIEAAANVAPPYLRGYQDGGIAKTPQVATLAEKGPEAVVPLTGMKARWNDLKSLYNTIKTTGRLPQPAEAPMPSLDKLMSMKPALRDAATRNVPSMPTQHIEFAPNITINGDASEAEQKALDTKLRNLAREFIESFKRAQYQERRLSYDSGYG